MNRILIVEDDRAISRLIEMSLTKNGYSCSTAFDGLDASRLIEDETFDLILLDVMLPEIDGFELMEYIKEYHTPVIFITAKSGVSDRVKGLRMGAEDYIVKPFDLMELNARVENVLRRYNKTQRYINIYNIKIDTKARRVTRGEEEVELTLKEFDILMLLAGNRGIALYRETIYERVWGEPYFGDTRTVDLHIQRLRKKLNLHDKICSVYKIGYMLKED